jgi:hypothetical protein
MDWKSSQRFDPSAGVLSALDGTFLLDPKLFGLKPGANRVEAALTGWVKETFTDSGLLRISIARTSWLRKARNVDFRFHFSSQRKGLLPMSTLYSY